MGQSLEVLISTPDFGPFEFNLEAHFTDFHRDGASTDPNHVSYDRFPFGLCRKWPF